ncbi:MAG: carboxypeptidase regulatory-like domain-containing protein, partial [Candidatus Marinimicrobia bacterium]|nr:carboxypeptidase regulatory-like domain-containing protein [Candidatus Neomarinimicrobiota bacterium]
MNKLHIYFYLLLGINILFAKENKFAISGSVIDSEGNPIKKVVVQLFDDRGDEIKDSKTGKKGNFKFKKIKLGEYTITASHISLGSANEKISLIDDNISITFTLSSDTIPSKLAG